MSELPDPPTIYYGTAIFPPPEFVLADMINSLSARVAALEGSLVARLDMLEKRVSALEGSHAGEAPRPRD